MTLCQASTVARCRWLITGQVQGVGFRPFVFRLAKQLRLTGQVRNGPDGVVIECQGDARLLGHFEPALRAEHPALAKICTITRENLPPLDGETAFEIVSSTCTEADHSPSAAVTVDSATCPACVTEVLSDTDRRHGYGLINCTDCGPRFSIIKRIPYDRCNTTMAQFAMCPACQAEYTNPADRRFHAQPIACHDCGPKVALVDPHGQPITGDPIQTARTMLLQGRILAIKGLGGFHLAVRADDQTAVQRLRQLKKRDHKPFALMAPSLEAARELVHLSDEAAALMRSPMCPIVLAARRDGASVCESVAAGNHRLGVMLPYTPIHHLLFGGETPLPPLVMTSGNVSDEPLVIDNHDAAKRLGGMCDAILWHDRPIERGVDDSVVIDIGNAEPIFIRRARGFVPGAIDLRIAATPRVARPDASGRRATRGVAASDGLCVGGELKSTIAVVRNGQAILSHHLGDLSHAQAFEAFKKAVADMRRLFSVQPQWIAHDLHPTYVSTNFARKLAAELNVPLLGVQHHHAHAAAVMAEHGISDQILAVVCDGTGYGTDGTIWGGELLAADLVDFARIAHLRPLRLPGGDAAARDTARCGLALLHHAFGEEFADHPATRRLVPDSARRGMLCRMIRDNVSTVHSSGAGRVFDGVAALLGLCSYNNFEAEAAMTLEAAAHRSHEGKFVGECTTPRTCVRGYEGPLFEIHGDEREIDLARLTKTLVTEFDRGTPAQDLALLFHEQFAQAWAAAVIDTSNGTGLRVVGLSGGVFCNAWLTSRLTHLLEQAGLKVLRHRVVPPNDGGLSLGQAAIAAAWHGRLTDHAAERAV